MNIDHINISAPMPVLEQIRDFYCAVLGLEDGFRPEFSKRGFWLYAGENPLIHLSESDRHFKNEKQGYLDHIAFQMRGVSRVVERLESLGVEYRASYVSEIKLTQLFFKDPAGTGIEANFQNEIL